MCGIIGYIGTRDAIRYLLEGLKILEYRGYDSCGIACLDDDLKIHIRKGVGSVEKVASSLKFRELKGKVGIAHTRWSTHGRVSVENAHPHTDCQGKIAIVHNGIIENYQELKEELAKKGHTFRSETDSEVIAHLIEEELYKEEDFEKAFMSAINRLEGSYAILAIREGERKILATRKFSPLVVGVTSHGFFVSSDIPSFLKWTNKVVYLHEDEIAVLAPNKMKVMDNNGNPVKFSVEEIAWSEQELEKGDFRHYMLKEILEQAIVIDRLIKEFEGNSFIENMETFARTLRNAEKIILTGCGTSYHAALFGSYFLLKCGRLLSLPLCASELLNYVDIIDEKTTVIAVSQSGETADVLNAVRLCKSKGARILSVINVEKSSLERISDEVLYMKAGPEIGVAATKTFTAEVILLWTLSKFLEIKKKDYLEDVLRPLRRIYLEVYNLTSNTMFKHLSKIAERLKNAEHIYVLGKGPHYYGALEASLKIKEISYIHAEAFPGGEIKHGPLALISEGSPVICLVDDRESLVTNIIEVKSRGAWVIGVHSRNNHIFDEWIKVPSAGDLTPLLQVVPMQILSYYLAILRGADPDKPRNLAKSVTVL